MIKSMTGFGRGVAESENYAINVEIKSVNHRFCELYVRSPKQLSLFEDSVKRTVTSRVRRGKVDIFISFEQIGIKKPLLKVDKELALAYYNAMSDLAHDCQLPPSIEINYLSQMPGIFTLESGEDDQEEIEALLKESVESAVNGLIMMRTTEGEALANDLLSHLDLVENAIYEIEKLAATVVAEQKQKLEQRISLLLEDIEVDQNRLANEIAFFADKVDINEELTRLFSHVKQFRQTLQSNDSVGRKLDFILQEMLREINTIGSKSNNLSINNLVIDTKNELDKIKEQIQNVE